MDLLTAVNRILPKVGEHPVTSLTGRHSTVSLILDEIETQIDRVSQRGWWFNEFLTTIQLNPDNEAVLPVDTLAFVPTVRSGLNAVQRNGKLFNVDTLTYTWSTSVEGIIRLRYAFNDLPESVAAHVWYSALCAVYVTDIGMASDLQKWMQDAAEAESAMQAEHLEQKKYSTARSIRYTRVRNAMRG